MWFIGGISTIKVIKQELALNIGKSNLCLWWSPRAYLSEGSLAWCILIVKSWSWFAPPEVSTNKFLSELPATWLPVPFFFILTNEIEKYWSSKALFDNDAYVDLAMHAVCESQTKGKISLFRGSFRGFDMTSRKNFGFENSEPSLFLPKLILENIWGSWILKWMVFLILMSIILTPVHKVPKHFVYSVRPQGLWSIINTHYYFRRMKQGFATWALFSPFWDGCKFVYFIPAIIFHWLESSLINSWGSALSSLHTLKNSITSSFRSPFSYLLTKDWGLPSFSESWVWVIPREVLASRKSNISFWFLSEYSVFNLGAQLFNWTSK